MKRLIRTLILLAVATALLTCLEWLSPPDRTLGWQAAFDVGHAPVFGLLAIVLLGLSLSYVPWSGRKRILHYLVAFGIAALASLLVEAGQLAGPRDADLLDGLRGVLGAAAFLLIAATFDGELRTGRLLGRGFVRVVLGVVAVALLVVSAMPLIDAGLDYRKRNAAFPRIAGFDAGWELRFLYVQLTQLTLEPLPERWRSGDSGRAAHVTFEPHPASGLVLREVYPDWTGFDHLAFTVYSEREVPVEICLDFDDQSHRFVDTDRFDFTFVVEPGENLFTLPLSALGFDTREDGLDPTRMCHVVLHAKASRETVTLYLDEFRLE